MPVPSDLDSIDLAILKAIARQPEILTRDIESSVYLSRSQVLRRLQRLEERELITKGFIPNKLDKPSNNYATIFMYTPTGQ